MKKEKPNKAPEPTTMAVTSPAAQEPRQPRSWLIWIVRRKTMALDTPILFAATTDAKRARAFYEDVLGLNFVSDDRFAIVFQVGSLALRVQKVAHKPKLEYTVLGWSVPNISEEVQRLSKAGVRFSRYEGLNQDQLGIWRSPSGAKVAWFSDPDGNTLSLTEHR